MKYFILLSACVVLTKAGISHLISGPYAFGYSTADRQSRLESVVGGAVQAKAGLISGPYAFGYSTNDGQSRQESGVGGAVKGSYSYVDANGDQRQVRYTADANGFRPEGDISVDRRTAAAAAHIASLAPNAPFTGHNSLEAPIAAPFASYAAPKGGLRQCFCSHT